MTDVYKPRMRFALIQWISAAIFVPFFLLFLAAFSPWLLLLPPLAFIAIIAYAYFWQQARSYEVRPDGIMVKSGVFTPSQSLLLYSQIQKVEEERSLAGEILDYTTLNVQTMSQDSLSAGQLTGIPLDAASRLQKTIEQNMRNGKATARPAKSETPTRAPKTVAAPLVPFPIQTLTGTWANGLYSALPTSFLIVFFMALQAGDVGIGLVAALFFAPAMAALLLVGTFIQLATLSYQVSDEWFEIKQAFLGQNVIRFRFDRVQNVLVHQTWLAKIAGIADVNIDTGENALNPNTANKKYNLASAIPALRLSDANQLKDYLLSQVGAPSLKSNDLRPFFPLDDTKPAKKTVGWVWSILLLFAVSIAIGATLNAFQIPLFNGINTFILSVGGLVVLLLVGGAAFLYEKAYFDRYEYRTTDTTLIIGKGVFGFDTIYVPYSRIQTVTVDQDLFDRVFGLADVHVSTIGSGSALQAHIDGVSVATAEKLKNELLARVKKNIS